jgi:AcrR family transcriptional regulator
MPVSSQPGWQRQRRQNILDAAAQLFGRAAYDAVQMDEVARAAGIGKPTLYRYFPSKDELFLEVFDEALRRLEERLEASRAATATPPEMLRAMIRLTVESLGEHIASLRLLTGEHSSLAERWRLLFRQRRRPLVESFRAVLAAGIDGGYFRPLDTDIVPALIIGMIRGGLMGVPDVPRERVVEAALSLVLQGCQAQAAPGQQQARRVARGE